MQRRGMLLLVEDEEVLRSLVAQFLRSEGYQTVEARDGQEGVDRFQDSGPFDLALVDINLPVYCGVEVCRRIRLQHPNQPIIICSAAIVPEHETILRGLGIHHFLTKPYHPLSLLDHIASELKAQPWAAHKSTNRPQPAPRIAHSTARQTP